MVSTSEIGGYFFNLLRSSKMQMAIFLFLIAASAVLFERQFFPFQIISLAVLTAVSTDLVLIRLRKIEPFLPRTAIVSGLIIGLLSGPTLPWYNTVVAAVMAMAGKNFLRYNNRHIFNPAASGLFIAGLLFKNSISWWGVSFQSLHINPVSLLFFLILLSPGYVSIIGMRRYKFIISFFIAYILLVGTLQLFQHSLDVKNLLLGTLFDPTTLFFSLVMLPEPMTTPNNPSRQLLFGAFVAMTSVVSGFIHFIFIPDPLITGLLIGNLIFFRFR